MTIVSKLQRDGSIQATSEQGDGCGGFRPDAVCLDWMQRRRIEGDLVDLRVVDEGRRTWAIAAAVGDVVSEGLRDLGCSGLSVGCYSDHFREERSRSAICSRINIG